MAVVVQLENLVMMWGITTISFVVMCDRALISNGQQWAILLKSKLITLSKGILSWLWIIRF